jgi:hypothetical protein
MLFLWNMPAIVGEEGCRIFTIVVLLALRFPSKGEINATLGAVFYR